MRALWPSRRQFREDLGHVINAIKNGLHEKVAWNYFATDEKIYYDDGTCDEFFENIMSLSQWGIDKAAVRALSLLYTLKAKKTAQKGQTVGKEAVCPFIHLAWRKRDKKGICFASRRCTGPWWISHGMKSSIDWPVWRKRHKKTLPFADTNSIIVVTQNRMKEEESGENLWHWRKSR